MPDASGPRRAAGLGVASRVAWAAEVASFAVPWLVAIGHTHPATRFTDDVALIRSFGLVPLGLEGLISMGFGSVFDALPIGSRVLRHAWLAALGLGALSWLVYRVTRALASATSRADSEPPAPRLERLLALSAALVATLAPTFMVEGSSPGGHTLAAALALGSVACALGVFGTSPRRAALAGVLAGAAALESRWAGVAALSAVAAGAVLHPAGVPARPIALFGAGAGVALALPAALGVAAWLSPGLSPALASIATDSGSLRLLPADRSAALSAWADSVGLPWCGLSVAGLALALFGRTTRPLALPLGAFLLLDAALGVSDLDPSRRDPHGAVRLLAIAALAASGALAVRLAIQWLERARLPFARAASTLVVMYGVALVFVSAESSAAIPLARENAATEEWTDEALESLPPSSVVLVRSDALLRRMLAARLQRGSRPDVLFVSMALLESGSPRARALAHEDGLLPLVRDMLLGGRPGEFALSQLADVRPVYLSPDSAWDRRLYSHLVPRPFFTEFVAHPLGRSDRKLGLAQASAAFERLQAAIRRSPDRDPATRALLLAELAERARILAALGDRDDARAAVKDLLALDPEAELGLRLEQQLQRPGRGPLDVGAAFANR